MQSSLVRNLLAFLATIALVIVFGYLGFQGITRLVVAISEGLFAHWEPLGTPPGGAVLILKADINNSPEKVVVELTDGKAYLYERKLFARWQPIEWMNSRKTKGSTECSWFDRPRPGLPHPIRDCTGFTSWENVSLEILYAVLEDGSVWRWRYGTGAEGIILYFTSPVIGGIIGFIIAFPVTKAILRAGKSTKQLSK